MILLICGIKRMINMNIQMILIYNTETDSKTDFMVASREGWRGKTFREFGIDMYTHCCFFKHLIFNMFIYFWLL